MSRTLPELPESLPTESRPRNLASIPKSSTASQLWNAWLLRIFLIAAFCAITVSLAPFGLYRWAAAGAGFVFSLAIVAAEYRLRNSSAAALLGGVMGGLCGALAALLVAILIFGTSAPEPTKSFLAYAALLAFGYVGIMLGSQKAIFFKPESLQGILRPHVAPYSPHEDGKLLDTSVLIDGRIAEICKAHFLDGPLLVPQFVLHELQMIADSADSMRRQRGRSAAGAGFSRDHRGRGADPGQPCRLLHLCLHRLAECGTRRTDDRGTLGAGGDCRDRGIRAVAAVHAIACDSRGHRRA